MHAGSQDADGVQRTHITSGRPQGTKPEMRKQSQRLGTSADREQCIRRLPEVLHERRARANRRRTSRPIDNVKCPYPLHARSTVSEEESPGHDASVSEDLFSPCHHERARARPVRTLLPVLPVDAFGFGVRQAHTGLRHERAQGRYIFRQGRSNGHSWASRTSSAPLCLVHPAGVALGRQPLVPCPSEGLSPAAVTVVVTVTAAVGLLAIESSC